MENWKEEWEEEWEEELNNLLHDYSQEKIENDSIILFVYKLIDKTKDERIKPNYF